MSVFFQKYALKKQTMNLGVCLSNWEWCCDPLVSFIPPKSRLLTQAVDDLIFGLELHPARNKSSEAHAAEWVEKRKLTCRQFPFDSNPIQNKSPAHQTLYLIVLVMQSFETTCWLPKTKTQTILEQYFQC